MDLQIVTSFFMWCTIINGGLFLFATIFLLLMPDLTCQLQYSAFPIPRETYNVVIYPAWGFSR